jgi:hypothetical protein
MTVNQVCVLVAGGSTKTLFSYSVRDVVITVLCVNKFGMGE